MLGSCVRSLSICREDQKERVTPSKQRNLLKAIEQTTKSLSQQLDEAGVKMWLATAGVVTVGRDEMAVNAELRKANERIADAVRALMDLRERAKTAARAASKRTVPGRGGSRHRPGAKGQLIKNAIAIYSHMRVQHPESGKRPGFGGPMLRFVRAVGKLCGDCMRDTDIREVWRVGKSKKNKF